MKVNVGRVRRALARRIRRAPGAIARRLPQPAKEGLRGIRRGMAPAVLGPLTALLGKRGATDRRALAASRHRPAVDPCAPVRLLVAPANFAGQGFLWARACQKHLVGVEARNMNVSSPFGFESDYEVEASVYRDPFWAREQERYVRHQYTHVLVEAERPLFGTYYGTTARELPRLRAAGLRVGLVSHGSDVRVPSEHVKLHPDSPFDDPAEEVQARLESIARRNRELLETFDGPVFASTPDLMDYVPGVRWLPTVVQPELWRSDWPLLARSIPVVVHIPSNGRLKGTELVAPVLQSLHDERVIDYRPLRNLKHEQVRAIVQEADIVLDQFVLGLYGVAALEAMAAGRVAVGYVDHGARERVKALTGLAVPIVDAQPHTLRAVLLGLLADRDAARETARSGREFVDRVHDGRFSAGVLAEFLGAEHAVPERAVPEPALGRSADSQSATSTERPLPPATPVRLLVGPANFAGQGFAWARAAERLTGVGAVSMMIDRPLRFSADYVVDAHTYNRSPEWARRQEAYLTEFFTHVLAEAGQGVTGVVDKVTARTLREELPLLREAGLTVALLAHGSELRVPSLHVATTPWSPFVDASWDAVARLEAAATRTRELFLSYEGPTFVSTPDLLTFAPDAVWLPVVVDSRVWGAAARPLFTQTTPVVAHIPSSSRLKGSDMIDPVLSDLDREGVIRYLRIGGIDPPEMPGHIGAADIVIDQLALGGYGVAACEAMAAGRVVLGHCTSAVRAHVRAATGVDLPIVEATADTLATVVRQMVDDRDKARTVADQGRQYVEAVHDGAAAAAALRPFLLG